MADRWIDPRSGRGGSGRRQWRRPRLLRRHWFHPLAIGLALAVAIGLAQLGPFSPALQLAAQEPLPESVRLRVIDGDTVEVRDTGERVRLENIDTPETGDRAQCQAEREAGARATGEARRLINGANRVSVRRSGRTDRYGRTIGWVFVDGRDLGGLLIEAGLARPWRGRREPWCGAGGELLR